MFNIEQEIYTELVWINFIFVFHIEYECIRVGTSVLAVLN
jgi:hypothetical protein